MAVRSPKRIVSGSQLTTSAATYYTAPAATTTTISACTLTNTTGTAQTATLHLVPPAGSAADSNCILFEYTIAAGASYNVPGAIGQTLPAGGTIQALASAGSAITIVASGYETA